jgi:hypothetical protein
MQRVARGMGLTGAGHRKCGCETGLRWQSRTLRGYRCSRGR